MRIVLDYVGLMVKSLYGNRNRIVSRLLSSMENNRDVKKWCVRVNGGLFMWGVGYSRSGQSINNNDVCVCRY